MRMLIARAVEATVLIDKPCSKIGLIFFYSRADCLAVRPDVKLEISASRDDFV